MIRFMAQLRSVSVVGLLVAVLMASVPMVASANGQGGAAAHPKPSTMLAKPVSVSPEQDTAEITLPENMTTGFRWWLQSFPSWLVPIESSYQAPPGSAIGASGIRHFKFRVLHQNLGGSAVPVTAELVFYYARSWDNSGVRKAVIRVFRLPSS